MTDLLNLLPETPDTNAELRREITRVLDAGPWKHRLHLTRGQCPKCGAEVSSGADWLPTWYGPCPIPDEAEGSWPDLAEQLRDKWYTSAPRREVEKWGKFWRACEVLVQRKWSHPDNLEDWFLWEAPARTRCLVLVMAMHGEAK
jgi:hypothetical protein